MIEGQIADLNLKPSGSTEANLIWKGLDLMGIKFAHGKWTST